MSDKPAANCARQYSCPSSFLARMQVWSHLHVRHERVKSANSLPPPDHELPRRMASARIRKMHKADNNAHQPEILRRRPQIVFTVRGPLPRTQPTSASRWRLLFLFKAPARLSALARIAGLRTMHWIRLLLRKPEAHSRCRQQCGVEPCNRCDVKRMLKQQGRKTLRAKRSIARCSVRFCFFPARGGSHILVNPFIRQAHARIPNSRE